MSQQPLIYPATPVNVPESVTRPSAAFKKEVSKVMGSIVFFFIVYLILIIIAACIAVAAVYGGIALIVAEPGTPSLLIGGGLIFLGVMVLFFLVKFIFAVSRFDSSGSIEIREEDHPRLYAFIRQLTTDTQTPFPKRIFLSPEVNACVFYDSGFWSMFLPVKKNLQIGLALVNAVNLSEFKAVMAHEFGHFSQRSMKLGSFVYNVNRVIYNMLYENTSYGRTLDRWGKMHLLFAIFATITAAIVRGIQYILRQMYGLINKNYMGLSREMEFHADAVSASVSGSDNCISALRRIELAGNCYSVLIARYNELYKEKCITGNLYPDQNLVTKKFAEEYKLSLQENLPVVDDAFLKSLTSPRINFKDQWASHPSLEERTRHLSNLAVVADRCTESPWILFDNAEEWQKKLTGKLYKDVEINNEIKTLDKTSFEEKLLQYDQLRLLPAAYNGFYDGRLVSKMDIEMLSQEAAAGAVKGLVFEDIFNTENAGLQLKIRSLEQDVEILKAISTKQIRTKTFDFEGEKYRVDEAGAIMDKLQKELTALQQQLETLDKNAFRYFYQKALQKSSYEAADLKNAWISHYAWREQGDRFYEKSNEVMDALQPLLEGRITTIEQAAALTNNVKSREEQLKELLRHLFDAGAFDHAPGFKNDLRTFLAKDYQYFSGEQFFDEELNTLTRLINESWQQLNNFQYRKFKELLEMQIRLN